VGWCVLFFCAEELGRGEFEGFLKLEGGVFGLRYWCFGFGGDWV